MICLAFTGRRERHTGNQADATMTYTMDKHGGREVNSIGLITPGVLCV